MCCDALAAEGKPSASHLSGVADVAQGLVGRRHGEHLCGPADKDLLDWDLEARAAENLVQRI